MPYITSAQRDAVIEHGALNVGELTYELTEACMRYLSPLASFSDLAEVIAALECCKLEFYRRCVSPYEDRKIALNGDVY